MITLRVGSAEVRVEPTIFPDGTSQVWKLPEIFVDSGIVDVIWRFESECEVIDIMSVAELLRSAYAGPRLYVPYLPYARQDKNVSNDATFNLAVLARILNVGRFSEVRSLDVHNYEKTRLLIDRFTNVGIEPILTKLRQDIRPDIVAFPDHGAFDRYGQLPVFQTEKLELRWYAKTREQSTGKILSHDCVWAADRTSEKAPHVLVVDDICDGGATFISLAASLRKELPGAHLHLYTTHGIYSRGARPLLEAGYESITCTDSLPLAAISATNIINA